MHRLVRQSHRWISILFVAIVAIVTTLQATDSVFAEWVYYLPLLPLFLLMLSGLYLFALPLLRRQ